MRSRLISLILSAVLPCAVVGATASPVSSFQLPEIEGVHEITGGCAYRPAGSTVDFVPYEGTLTLGFRYSALEILCNVHSRRDTRLVRVQLAAPWLDRVEFLSQGNSQPVLAGELVPAQQRALNTRSPAFSMTLKNGLNTFMFRIHSPGSRMVLPFELHDEAVFLANESRDHWLLGGFFGFIVCLAVVSFVFGGFSRDPVFFTYAFGLIANLGLFFIQFGLPGVLFSYAGSALNTLTVFLTGVTAIFFTEFHRQYLRVTAGWGYQLLRATCAAGVLVALQAFIVPFPPAVQVSLYFVILLDVVLLTVLVARLLDREIRYSGFYLAAWVIFLGGVMLHLLTLFGAVPANTLMRSAFHASFLVQSLLFTLALGSKHRELLEQEKSSRIAMKLIEQEYRQASDIHRRLLPDKTPAIPQLELDVLYIPMGQLGGDFYTFLEQADGSWLFLIADVQGHGLPAALDASSVKLAFHEAAGKKPEPAAVLAEMNRLLALHLRNRFISAQVLRWLPGRRVMQIASAGHPYPLLCERIAENCRELRAEGSILGLYPEASYREIEASLAPGDFLLVYTDGLIEDPASQSSYEEDIHNLMSVIESFKTGKPAVSRFESEMPRFRISKPWSDDVTALLFICP